MAKKRKNKPGAGRPISVGKNAKLVGVKLAPGTYALMDRARGDTPRAEWIRGLVIAALT